MFKLLISLGQSLDIRFRLQSMETTVLINNDSIWYAVRVQLRYMTLWPSSNCQLLFIGMWWH